MDNDPHPFELGKNRIEALSDGVFAIAMTLLILEFHVPSLPHNASNVVVLPALLRLWPKFVTYAISFASLGVFWIGHHNMYHAIRRSDRVLLWLNIVFFMFVSFLPFSTSILNAFIETSIAPLFFGGNLVLLGWTLYAQWAYARRQTGMISSQMGDEYLAMVQSRFLAYPIIAMLTMLVCFWSVSISLAIYLCLLPLYMIPGRAERRPPETTSRGAGRRRLKRKMMLAGGLGAIAIFAAWAAFRPELLLINHKVHESLPAAASASGAAVLSAGEFHGVAHQTHGDVRIIQLPDGGKVLRLTRFATSNGPDVHILLIHAADATDNDTVTSNGYLALGKLKGNEGDQFYDIPARTDLSAYHGVTIWCMRFQVNFATAPLKTTETISNQQAD
ncbi:hypothetical protein CCAX7_63390 [Capsulimonas corticalis]|uniref:Uncharacterized protein n=1 Tax=Capsulimonas corticalis TaxID=2219043 RepID=A0A402CWW7_9BACT|nr:DM13 domain-containing protein [Capsulimonas corticalis]BDI34288.1 hypothetical protein CCAX7_63390 [Capsulimonas corticalis]